MEKALSSTPAFLAPYRRITSSGKFIPEIDGLRFIAIASVFVYHLAGDILRHSTGVNAMPIRSDWIFHATQVLNFGVQLFFVVSGFILCLPFATAHLDQKPTVPLRKYFIRRLTRLEPPYVLCLLLFFGLKILLGKGTLQGLFPHLGASLFYLHNWAYQLPSEINFVAWSLEVEVQFYILAPLFALLFLIKSARLRRSVLVAAVLSCTALSLSASQDPRLRLTLASHCQYFFAGFVLVEFFLFRQQGEALRWLWDLVALVSGAFLLVTLMHGGYAGGWFAPWLIVLLFVGSFQGVFFNSFVVNPWISTIGGMCYSIYLLHNYVIASVGNITERLLATSSFSLRLAVQVLLMGPIVLMISALYFRFIERPCMRPDWWARLMRRPEPFKKRESAALAAQNISS